VTEEGRKGGRKVGKQAREGGKMAEREKGRGEETER